MHGSDAAQSFTRLYRCSFCAKSQVEVRTLISGPGVFICDECVELCRAIVKRKATALSPLAPEPRSAPSPLLPSNAPTEALLKTLSGYNGAFERIDAGMQDIVDILRERDVSWAAIGEALAVSRQAAWKRFG